MVLAVALSKGVCLAAPAPATGAETSLLADLAVVCSVNGTEQKAPGLDPHSSGECDGCQHMQPSMADVPPPAKVGSVEFVSAADFLIPACDRPAFASHHLHANGSRAPPAA
ncbi:MAG: hypothetical protein ACM31L_14020 [Actinomycetota bacterium]